MRLSVALLPSAFLGSVEAQGFDLTTFVLHFAGVKVSAEIAQSECPSEWGPVVSCMVRDCPQFLDVCPGYQETESIADVARASDPDIVSAAPSCEVLETTICLDHSGPDCCMNICNGEIFALAACVVLQSTGEDRSDCLAPTCEDSAWTPEEEAEETLPSVTASSNMTVSEILMERNMTDLLTYVDNFNNTSWTTVFSPTDEAWLSFSSTIFDWYTENVGTPSVDSMLEDIVLYHYVPGLYLSENVTLGQEFQSVSGETLTLGQESFKFLVNDAVILEGDIVGSDGVVHVIDRVMIPSTISLCADKLVESPTCD